MQRESILIFADARDPILYKTISIENRSIGELQELLIFFNFFVDKKLYLYYSGTKLGSYILGRHVISQGLNKKNFRGGVAWLKRGSG